MLLKVLPAYIFLYPPILLYVYLFTAASLANCNLILQQVVGVLFVCRNSIAMHLFIYRMIDGTRSRSCK
jgi:hypothetical protein